MSFGVIKAQLVTLEGTITGIKRVYANRPSQPPTLDDFPAVINDYDPANIVVISISAGGLVRYTWQFVIKFMLRPVAQGTIEEWDADLEVYPARFIQKLLGSLTLSGNATDQDLRSAFRPGIVDYRGSFYLGFALPWNVHEDVPTTISA